MIFDFWRLVFVDSKGFLCLERAIQVDQNLYDPFEIKISQRRCVGSHLADVRAITGKKLMC